mmetsp:Transcript_50445/g.134896  ORF Transcript_50445/g.134896 Transcript_50445/m.134896 type:complete len:272 (+) Transcript_50445:397-1212(+)
MAMASAPAVKRLSLATWASVAWRERCCCSSAAASSLSESASSSPHSWAWATTSLDDAAGVGDCCMVMAIAMASAPAVRRLSLATWASVAWRDSCCCCCGAAASSSESASSSSHSWASATTATSMEETAGVEECCTTIAMASAPAVKRRSLATWASRAWRDGSSSESASSSPHSVAWATTSTSLEDMAGVDVCCTAKAMASAPAVKRLSLAVCAPLAWRESSSSSESASSSPHSLASSTTATSLDGATGTDGCCIAIAMASAPAVRRLSLAT